MSCTFWNMRRRLKAQQQQKEKTVVDSATKQKADTQVKEGEKQPVKKQTKRGAE